MHKFTLSKDIQKKVITRRGRLHAFESIDFKKTALIVIDMQNAFVEQNAGHAWIPEAASTCKNINKLSEKLRQYGSKIVWILNTYTDESSESWSHFHKSLSTNSLFKLRSECMAEGSYGHKLYKDLITADEDIFVKKTRYSAFIQGSSNLNEILQKLNIDTLLISGTATNVCCESTARDAMMLNYKTIMISDACSAENDDLHSASLSSFILNFGDVLTTEEIINSN